MKTLTFQFVKDKSIEGAAIRWKGDSDWQHVNLCTPDGKLLGALMEGGIQKREPNYANFELQSFVTIIVTDEQYDTFWTYAYSRIGEAYNKKGILGEVLGTSVSDPAHDFCSEYGSVCIITADIFYIAKDPDKVDPDELYLMLCSQPGATEQRIPAAKGVGA